MKSIWKDGSSLLYGGSGYHTPFADSAYIMYPGNTDPNWYTTRNIPQSFNWTEECPEITCIPNDPGPRRSVFSMGPLTFSPNEKKSFDIAYLFTWYKSLPNGPTTSQLLNRMMLDSLKAMWVNQNFPCFDTTSFVREIDNFKFNIYPNPASTEINVSAEKFKNKISWKLLDLYGRILKNGVLNSNGKTIIPLENLIQGIYFMEFSDGLARSKYKIIIQR